MSYWKNFVGTEKRVRIIHGKRAIRVRAIEVILYNPLSSADHACSIPLKDIDRCSISLDIIDLSYITLNGITLYNISLNGIALCNTTLNGIALCNITLNGIALCNIFCYFSRNAH